MALLARYNSLLKTAPLRTKALTSVTLSVTGDLLAQDLARSPLDSRQCLDHRRTVIQGLWSLANAAPMHYWFQGLSKVPRIGPIPQPVVACLIDQVVLCPISHAAYFAWISAASSGFKARRSDISADVREKLWPALKACYTIWPTVFLLNVAYVPLHLRLPFMNGIGFFYGIWMSWLANDRGNESKSTSDLGRVPQLAASYSSI
jgi:hypothetical protein